MYQQQYWKELQDIKTHAYYLELYQLDSERIERNCNMFLAVTSSASIGAWAILKDYAMIWGAVIAASQVLSVVYKFFPFKARIKPLGITSIAMFSLADEAEEGWYDVAEGELTDKQVHEKRMAIRHKKTAIMRAAFPASTLPVNDELLRLAGEKMEQYFNNYFPGVDYE